MTQRVFVDANVLASRTLLDWLHHLRENNEGMFQLHSTCDVFVEALRVSRKRNPRAPGSLLEDRLKKIRYVIDETIDDFPGNGPFTGTDDGDYHVHAAATASRADMILTNNDPADITQTPDDEPYEIITADDFFMLVIESNPHCLLPATRNQFAYWSSRGAGQLDDKLIKADCPQFAKEVRRALSRLALEL